MIEFDLLKHLHGPSGAFDLQIRMSCQSGEIIALFGPSGAGKTSTLRMLAGLLTPDGGFIRGDGAVWFDRPANVNLVPRRRNIGYVFQDYALFPNLTVRGQLEYALPPQASSGYVDNLLGITGLSALADRKPDSLSGGQQQRVALARALVRRPSVLLLDEPLAALDRNTRMEMQNLILKLHREFRPTIFLVTHDVGEIWKLADTVVMIDNGIVQRSGHPRSAFLSSRLSGKFQFVGEVLEISREGVLHVITLLVENQISKVVADPGTALQLQIGDRVIVASKAFNPIVRKIES